MHERALMTALVKQHLERARQRMKDQADKHRSERSFIEGDRVFVKWVTQPVSLASWGQIVAEGGENVTPQVRPRRTRTSGRPKKRRRPNHLFDPAV